MRMLPVGFALVVTSCSLMGADDKAGQAPTPAGWKEFIPKNKLSVVAFPEGGKIKETYKSIVLKGGGGQIRMYRTTCEVKGGPTYILNQLDLPPAVIRGPWNERQDMLRDMAVEEFEGKLVTEKSFNLGKEKCKEYTIKTPDGMVRLRMIGASAKVYRLVVIGTKEQADSKDTETFFKSFRKTSRIPKAKDKDKDK